MAICCWSSLGPIWCIFGLAIITIGSGFFLPSLPPLINNLYKQNDAGRDSGFTLYYLCKNVGALLGPITCGLIAQHYGFNYAFLLSAIVMFLGVIIFISGQKYLDSYQEKIITKTRLLLSKKYYLMLAGTFIAIPLMEMIFIKNLDSYLLMIGVTIMAIYLAYLFITQPAQQHKNLLIILILLLFTSIFIAFLAQGGSTLNLFIERIVNRRIFGTTIPTSVFYAIDPIFMLSIGPFLALLFLKLSRHKKEPSAITKASIGLVALAFGFCIFSIASYFAEKTGTSSPTFVIASYFIFPIAELLVVPPVLSFITKHSPQNNVSTMVSLFMFAQGLGGYLTGQLSKFGNISFKINSIVTEKAAAVIYQHAFLDFTFMLLIAGGILFLISRVQNRFEPSRITK